MKVLFGAFLFHFQHHHKKVYNQSPFFLFNLLTAMGNLLKNLAGKDEDVSCTDFFLDFESKLWQNSLFDILL